MRSRAVNIKYFKIIRRPDMTCPNGYLIYCTSPQIYTHGSFNPCFCSKVETVATAGRDTVVLRKGMGLGTPSLWGLLREKHPGSAMQVGKSHSHSLSLALLESLVTRQPCFAAKAVWVHLVAVACTLGQEIVIAVEFCYMEHLPRLTTRGRTIRFKSSNGKSHHSQKHSALRHPSSALLPLLQDHTRREMLWGRWGISASGGGWRHGQGLGRQRVRGLGVRHRG